MLYTEPSGIYKSVIQDQEVRVQKNLVPPLLFLVELGKTASCAEPSWFYLSV